MGEEHALRITRCAGGVAQHRRGSFVYVCPHIAALRCEQCLIIKCLVGSSGYSTHHDALDLRTFQLADRIECKFSDGRVMEEKFAARMLEDEFDLSRGQSHVDCIQHGAERRSREIKLEMPVRIPCQARRDRLEKHLAGATLPPIAIRDPSASHNYSEPVARRRSMQSGARYGSRRHGRAADRLSTAHASLIPESWVCCSDLSLWRLVCGRDVQPGTCLQEAAQSRKSHVLSLTVKLRDKSSHDRFHPANCLLKT